MMFAEFTTIEKAKGLLGFIIILGLGYYAYPYDLLSLLFGAITIALIVRLLWVSKMNYEMGMETHNAIASIILEGSALRTQAMYKHVIFNPDLYDESYEKVSFDNDELYDFGYVWIRILCMCMCFDCIHVRICVYARVTVWINFVYICA